VAGRYVSLDDASSQPRLALPNTRVERRHGSGLAEATNSIPSIACLTERLGADRSNSLLSGYLYGWPSRSARPGKRRTPFFVFIVPVPFSSMPGSPFGTAFATEGVFRRFNLLGSFVLSATEHRLPKPTQTKTRS
jgi:hypothetical protein